MANVLTTLFGNVRDNLTKFELVATAILDAQAVILQLVAPVAPVAKYVSVGLGVLATVSLIVKNVLANTAASKP